jgi:hypothetical protein
VTKLFMGSLWDQTRPCCCGLHDKSLRGSSPWPFLYIMDLNGNKTLCGKSLGSNQAARRGLLDNSLRGSNPRPFIQNGLKWQQDPLWVALGIKPGRVCRGLPTIVSGIRAPGHSYAELNFEWQNVLLKPMTSIKSSNNPNKSCWPNRLNPSDTAMMRP